MVENKIDDFGGERTDPPIIAATAVEGLPNPSAPMEFQPPCYEEAMTANISSDIHVIPPPPEPTLQPVRNDGGGGIPSNEDTPETDVVVASGTTAAVLGFFFMGGPIGAVLLGFSAAYAAQKEGAAGDIARTVGDIGVTVRQKAQQINNKHQIVDRSAKAATKAWESAKEYDRQHHVLDKTVDALIRGWHRFIEFVKEHRLMERGMEGAGRGYEFVAERLSNNSIDGRDTGSGNGSAPSAYIQSGNIQSQQQYSRVPTKEATVY